MSAADWRAFADRVAPEREARYPGSVPLPGQMACPRHKADLGPTTQMCPACFRQAWAWTGRLYEAKAAGLDGSP